MKQLLRVWKPVLWAAGLLAVAALVSIVLAQPIDSTHLVKPGETANSIATRYDVTVDALLVANGLSDSDQIMTGQILVIPISGETIHMTATPRSEILYENSIPVFSALPTSPPAPTPLPYDPTRTINLISPNKYFVVNYDGIPLRGVVQMDPDTTDFWKFEISGGSSGDRILNGNIEVPAFGWITINSGTESVIDGQLGLIPGYPTLNEGFWKLRVVVVAGDGTFVAEEVLDFRVQVDDIP